MLTQHPVEPSKGILKKSTVFAEQENTLRGAKMSPNGGFSSELLKARNKLGKTKSISFLDECIAQ